MADRKLARIRFSYFNNEKTEQMLSRMAEQGWLLTAEKRSLGRQTLFGPLHYRRGTPQRLHYSIVPGPNVNQDARELDELCAAAGWELLAVKHRFRIYVNAREEPVAIYTDPQDSMDRYGQFVRRRILTVGGLELLAYTVYLIWYVGALGGELRWAFEELTGFPIGITIWTALIVLLLLFLCYLAAVLVPLWCGKRALRRKSADWPQKVRRSEIGSRWVQMIAPVMLITCALLACTDAIDWPYQHGDPPLAAADLGCEREVVLDYMSGDNMLFKFHRYYSYVSEESLFSGRFFYVYVQSPFDHLAERLARNEIVNDEFVKDTPQFSRDGIDVYYFINNTKVYMVGDGRALYVDELPGSIEDPAIFNALTDCFFAS